jgi:hypothetical protein
MTRRWNTIFFLLLALCLAVSGQGLQINSPAGGEAFTAGQSVTITWSSSSGIDNVSLSFSFDAMKNWDAIVGSTPNTGSYTWIVPYFKTAKQQVWIKIAAVGINIFDTTNTAVSIGSATPDAYEPNNDTAHATPLTMGDTIHTALAMYYGGIIPPESRFGVPAWGKGPNGVGGSGDSALAFVDMDYYKITVASAKLVTVRLLPEYSASQYNDQNRPPVVYFLDSTGKVLKTGTPTDSFTTPAGGTFYCAVGGGPAPNQWAWYYKYGIVAFSKDAASLSLLSPAGGEAYSGGQSVSITWSASPSISAVAINFSFDNGKNWDYIAGSTPNNGSYSWTVPYFKTAKPQVRIKITAAGTNNIDSTDTPVSIAAAAPDSYEPNDDTGHATSLALGDTIHNAMAMYYGGNLPPESRFGMPAWGKSPNGVGASGDSALAFVDVDYYKITVPSAKFLTVTTLPEFDATRYNDQNRGPTISLLDSTGKVLASGTSSVAFQTTSAGTFYCTVCGGPAPNLWAWYFKYGITAKTDDAGIIALTKPAGGENFTAGQPDTITWSSSGAVTGVSVYFSFDNKVNWDPIASSSAGNGSFIWKTPYFKTAKPQVWIRVTTAGTNISAYSAAPVSIAAAAPDAYEPNNDTGHATPLSMGDTLHNAMAMYYGGMMPPESRFGFTAWGKAPNGVGASGDSALAFVDMDYFKMSVSAAKLVCVRTVPESDSSSYNGQHRPPFIYIIDSLGKFVWNGEGTALFNSQSGGTYYCIVGGGMAPNQWAWYFKYGICAKIVGDLEVFTIGPSSFTQQGSSYVATVQATKSNMSLSLVTHAASDGSITVASLAADSSVIAPPSGCQGLSIVSLEASNAIDSVMDSAKIVLGYTDSTLRNAGGGTIQAKWYNDSLGLWQDITATADTANNTVTINTTHFSVYGLFVQIPTKIRRPHYDAAVMRPGFRVDCRAGALSFRVTPASPGRVIALLYSINGKKICTVFDRFVPAAGGSYGPASSASVLPSGCYLLRISGPGINGRALVPVVR